MFLRPLNARLRAAQRALEAGRLDQALEAFSDRRVREDARVQRLADEVARPLLARARVHFQNGRYREALADIAKLSEIGRLDTDAEVLRERIRTEFEQRANRDEQRRNAERAAAQQIDQGRLESARIAVDQVADPGRRAVLQHDLDARLRRSDELIGQAEAALASGDLPGALRYWQEAGRRHGRTSAADALARRIAAHYRDEMQRCFMSGRIAALIAGRETIAALRVFEPELEQFDLIARLCERAGGQIRGNSPADLRETLLRLRSGRAEVSWLNAALEAVSQLAEAHQELLGSPLGAIGDSRGAEARAIAVQPDRNALQTEHSPDHTNGVASLAQPLLVMIDGAASGLIVARTQVRIGREGGDEEIEIPIPADVHSRHADIERVGDDYFLTPVGPVSVNQHNIRRRTLLRDGDRIVLGPKARMTFHKPSARSAAAVLRLSHRCRLANDVSEIVLLAETCLLGPQPSCHFRTREGRDQAVLFERGGVLHGRGVYSNGLAEKPRPIPLGQTTEFGDVRLTVMKYSLANRG